MIEQLKDGGNALGMPLYDLVSNRAHMVIATLAWNLKSWFAMMLHLKKDRLECIRMDFRTFLHQMKGGDARGGEVWYRYTLISI